MRITYKTLKISGWQHFQRDLIKTTVDFLKDVNVRTLEQDLQLKTVQTGTTVLMENSKSIDYLCFYTPMCWVQHHVPQNSYIQARMTYGLDG